MESQTVAGWLYTRLTADSALMALVGGVSEAEAPQGSAPPYVVYQAQSPGVLTLTQSGDVVLSNSLWLVKVIGQTRSFAALGGAVDRTVAALQHATGVSGGGRVISLHREGEFRQAYTGDDGKPYRELGYFWRCNAQ